MILPREMVQRTPGIPAAMVQDSRMLGLGMVLAACIGKKLGAEMEIQGLQRLE